MNLTFTYRHLDSSLALETRLREQMAKIGSMLPPKVDVHCIMSVEGHRNIAEINLTGSHLDLSAHESTDDMYKSLDAAVKHLERQIKKQKDKQARH